MVFHFMQSAKDIIYDCRSELKFKTTKSSGPGGQHVNKTETRVTLMWDLVSSSYIDDETKLILVGKLSSYISKEGVMSLSDQTFRSQKKNKNAVIEKWEEILIRILKPVKKRKATKPSKGSKRKAKDLKKKHSEKKDSRKKIILSKYS